jgi:hypothetical protein
VIALILFVSSQKSFNLSFLISVSLNVSNRKGNGAYTLALVLLSSIICSTQKIPSIFDVDFSVFANFKLFVSLFELLLRILSIF